jgi:hypothetical protein
LELILKSLVPESDSKPKRTRRKLPGERKRGRKEEDEEDRLSLVRVVISQYEKRGGRSYIQHGGCNSFTIGRFPAIEPAQRAIKYLFLSFSLI